jgi:gluconolactonase
VSAVCAESLVEDGAKPEIATKGYVFTEGPAADAEGNLYFTDVVRAMIFKLTPDGETTTFATATGGTNGLYFDAEGNLIGCQNSGRALVGFDPSGAMTVLVDSYEGKKLNSPNDLWIDAKGGIYFTDPRYMGRDVMEQDGEFVFYLQPDRKTLAIAADGFDRPNGIVGTPDGKTLYVADHAAGKTYRFAIQEDGSLGERTLFAEQGSDGLTLDERGNVYLTGQHVDIFSPDGEKIETIEMEVQPSNVRFAGPDRKTLYITARTRVYSLPMTVSGP